MSFAGVAMVVLEAAHAVAGCTVPGVATPQQIVDQAEVIAVVRAPGDYVVEPEEPENRFSRGELEFDVVRVLKGDHPGPATVRGRLADRDDYNDRSVPYDFIRKGGRGGSCFAFGYRPGAPYLFIMQYRDGRPTPYWSALAPTNEQLQPAFRTDSWFKWVRKRIRRDSAGSMR